MVNGREKHEEIIFAISAYLYGSSGLHVRLDSFSPKLSDKPEWLLRIKNIVLVTIINN